MIKIPLRLFIISLLSVQTLFAYDNSEVTEHYIRNYGHIAINEMNRVGIPASIKMAQAILESNSGRSTLARQSNNHFGIKCGKSWTGGEVYHEDDDYENGLLIRSCFRAYDDPAESFMAHSEFLANPYSKRYKFLFDLDPQDYKSWARGLKKAGYATDPNYPSKLIDIIEKYRLYELDMGIYPEGAVIASAHEIQGQSPATMTEATVVSTQHGSKEVAVTTSSSNTKDTARTKYRNRLSSDGRYIVKHEDTMAAIGQEFNIPLQRLYVQNRMPFGSQPKMGEKLALNGYIHLKDTPAYWENSKESQIESTLWSETIVIAMD
jgi:hypothetical protein